MIRSEARSAPRRGRRAGRRHGRGLRRRAVAALAVVGVLAVGAAGCASKTSTIPPGPPAAATVQLRDVAFLPGHVTIHVGQTVRWVWDDAPILHNVTFASFHSPTQSTGTWSHTFTTAGTFPYRCTIHFDMNGVVTVVS